MPSLEARYHPPGSPPVVLWTRPLGPRQVHKTLGQTSEATDPDRRCDWGIAHPAVEKKHQGTVAARHAELVWNGSELQVIPLLVPKYPGVIHSGDSQPATKPFAIRIGGSFAIGFFEFRLVDTELTIQIDPVKTGPAKLVDTDALIRVLLTLIDETGLPDDERFATLMLEKLCDALPRAEKVGVVGVPQEFQHSPRAIAIHPPDARVSQTDADQARYAADNRKISLWRRSNLGQDSGIIDPSRHSLVDPSAWGIYVPIDAPGGREQFVVFARGKLPERLLSSQDMIANRELKRVRETVQVIASVYSALLRLRQEQRRTKELLQYLPHPVRYLAKHDPQGFTVKLTPDVVKVTVLFCDIRGFTSMTEKAEDLTTYWNDILREALSLMAEPVVEQGGTIGSFLGDAVMAFWGWPNDTRDQRKYAVHAANGIWRRFRRAQSDPDSPLSQLDFGIGIAHGYAVAGRLGTDDQSKVDVIGPTVNLASRLEGMTKTLGAKVLLDAATFEGLTEGEKSRVRRVGLARPYGFSEPVDLYELHTPLTEQPDVSREYSLQRYSAALDHFEAGNAIDAAAALARIVEQDSVARFMATILAMTPLEIPHLHNGRRFIPMASK